jgi:hypothetical protein
MSQTTQPTVGVFLQGDPAPLETNLTVEQVAALIGDVGTDPHRCAFIRIPSTDGREALVRPHAIVAIVPSNEDD